MCLCKGTGKITEQIGSVITFNACPDSHCTHDKTNVYKDIKSLGDAAREMKRELIGS